MTTSDNDKKARMVRVPDEASGLAFYVELTDEQGLEMSRLMKAIDKVGWKKVRDLRFKVLAFWLKPG